MNSKMKKC